LHTSTTSSTATSRPGNVLIRRSDGAAKLTDFGLACRAGEKAPNFGAKVAGTYGYISPEVLRGERATSLSDLYSLGALAYRLLAGPPEPRRAATGDRGGACPRLRRLADVRPGLPVGVADAVDHALEHDPDARQSSVAEFRSSAPGRRRTRRAAHATGGSVTTLASRIT
jgi:serine/threonine protein kinase